MSEKNLFKLKISATGTLHGNITSNTFFGVFCQAYKMVHDEEELRILLECLKDNTEEMTFSNMLKPGTNELLLNVGVNYRPRCMIDRIRYTSGELFMQEDKYAESFDVLMYTTLDKKQVRKLSDIVELLGIGANKSSGGKIKITAIEEEQVKEHGKQMTLLSDIVPDEETPVHGDIRFKVRHGMTKDGKQQASIIQIKAGSVLANNKVDKPVYGVVLYDEKSDTFINCRGIAV